MKQKFSKAEILMGIKESVLSGRRNAIYLVLDEDIVNDYTCKVNGNIYENQKENDNSRLQTEAERVSYWIKMTKNNNYEITNGQRLIKKGECGGNLKNYRKVSCDPIIEEHLEVFKKTLEEKLKEK